MGFISEIECEIFVTLLEEGKSDVEKLKELTNRGQATIYRYMEKHEELGLVKSSKAFPEDAGISHSRKRKYFSLTKKGEEVAEMLKKINKIMKNSEEKETILENKKNRPKRVKDLA